MISTGKIVKIKNAPHFKFRQWWVDVEVTTAKNETFSTSVNGSTKLEVIQLAQIGKFTTFAH